MMYLLLNVVFASGFMLLIKWASVRGREDILTIGPVNYVVAAVLIAPFFFTSPAGTLTVAAALTGGTLGLCYFAAYFFVIYTIRWIGAASSTAISVLSILVPIGFGMFVWNEWPGGWQMTGILMALASLSMIGGQKGSSRAAVRQPWFAPIILVVFFLLCGTSRLAQEAFRHWCTTEEIMTFNFAAFLLAAMPSIAVLLTRGKTISRSEFAFGFAMGSCNFLQTLFILAALQRFEGYIVFPVVSAGAIILTTLVATQRLGERLKPRTWVGIAVAAVSLVLLKGLGQ
jgi:drug/metabolite transporter (DMT)-like permease